MAGLQGDLGALRDLRNQRAEPPEMTRRSWYVARQVADELADLVDDLHHETRVPKHQVLAALLNESIDRAAEVRERLVPRTQRRSTTPRMRETPDT